MAAFERIRAAWVYGGFLAGLMLAALWPVLTAGWDRPSALAFLCLVAYMLHQFEEHDDDRFRRFVNARIGGGREVLSVGAVFWINILGVWVTLSACLWLARVEYPGWAALAGWALVVNGLLHVGQAFALRCYNPGLATGALLFLPLGGATLAAAWPEAGGGVFWFGLAVVVAIHLAILAHVGLALRRPPAGAAN